MSLLDVTLATGYREWMEDAFCKQLPLDTMYPETPEDSWAAKQICWTQCPVIGECLRHAMAEGEFEGIWGGTTPPQRRTLARDRRSVDTWSPRACNRNHPGEEPEPAFRSNGGGKGRWRCRACDRVYTRNRRAAGVSNRPS